MRTNIPNDAKRGDIIRAYIPHCGETEVYPRNLLVLGFVFARDAVEPHAIATARFTTNIEKAYAHDLRIRIDAGPVVEGLRMSQLMFRANRVDFIPLDSSHVFGKSLQVIGHVGSDFLEGTLKPALEAGTAAPDATPSLYLPLAPSERVLSTPNPGSAPAWVPDQLPKGSAFYNDYDLAVIERNAQHRAASLRLHEIYLAASGNAITFFSPKKEFACAADSKASRHRGIQSAIDAAIAADRAKRAGTFQSPAPSA